ncbi:MAG: twin-arginine translocation signal domain-containing protein [Verrucomicrobiota bacterium]
MKTLTRRQFLRRSAIAAGTASALPFPFVGRVLGANDRINVACIGVGGKGDSDSSDAGCMWRQHRRHLRRGYEHARQEGQAVSAGETVQRLSQAAR